MIKPLGAEGLGPQRSKEVKMQNALCTAHSPSPVPRLWRCFVMPHAAVLPARIAYSSQNSPHCAQGARDVRERTRAKEARQSAPLGHQAMWLFFLLKSVQTTHL